MDAAVDATPFGGAWASIRGYFTPATFFLVLNLVIGTIALTSRSHQRRRREHRHDYAQAHYQEPPQIDPHQHYYYQQQQQPHQYYATPSPPPAPLARTSSVLDRLRSIGLYRFRSGDFPPEYGAPGASGHDAPFAPVEEGTTKQAAAAAVQYASRSRSEPAPAREAPPRMKKSGTKVIRKTHQAARRPPAARQFEAADARAEGFTGSLRQDEPSSPREAEYLPYQQEYVPPPAPMRAPPPLSRTSSVLDRLRSLGLYSFLAADQPAAASNPTTDGFAAAPAGDKKQTPAHAHYDRSLSEPAREQVKKEKKQAAEARLAKSSSTTRKAAAAAAPSSLAEEDCVDARAEAFIDSFRKEQSQKQVHHDEDEHAVPPPPAPLSRTSSVLDRLRSLGLYSFLAADQPAAAATPITTVGLAAAPAGDKKQTPAHAHYDRSLSEPAREQAKKEKKQAAEARLAKSSSTTRKAAAAAAPSLAEEDCVDARAEAFIDSFRKLQSQKQVHHVDEDEHVVVPPPPAPLARTSSVLDRFRSFSLYLRSGDPVPEDPYKVSAADDDEKKQAQYARCRSEPTREQGKKKAQRAQARTSKTTGSEAAPAEECVDARADDFINKFRQQLQLQRLNSLLNYN